VNVDPCGVEQALLGLRFRCYKLLGFQPLRFLFVSGHSAGAYNAVMLASEPKFIERHGGRCTVDHHHAQADEQNGRREQNPVRFELTSHRHLGARLPVHRDGSPVTGAPLQSGHHSPETMRGRRTSIVVSGQQSSVGLG